MSVTAAVTCAAKAVAIGTTTTARIAAVREVVGTTATADFVVGINASAASFAVVAACSAASSIQSSGLACRCGAHR